MPDKSVIRLLCLIVLVLICFFTLVDRIVYRATIANQRDNLTQKKQSLENEKQLVEIKDNSKIIDEIEKRKQQGQIALIESGSTTDIRTIVKSSQSSRSSTSAAKPTTGIVGR